MKHKRTTFRRKGGGKNYASGELRRLTEEVKQKRDRKASARRVKAALRRG